MRCPTCNHDNRAERRFCAECGAAALAARCAACGLPNEPGEKFCGGCGERLSPALSPASPQPAPRPAATPAPALAVVTLRARGAGCGPVRISPRRGGERSWEQPATASSWRTLGWGPPRGMARAGAAAKLATAVWLVGSAAGKPVMLGSELPPHRSLSPVLRARRQFEGYV